MKVRTSIVGCWYTLSSLSKECNVGKEQDHSCLNWIVAHILRKYEKYSSYDLTFDTVS